MTYLSVLSPLIVAILIFVAYLGGKAAGKKEAELKQIKKEQTANGKVEQIIHNNNNASTTVIDAWLHDVTRQ